MRKTALPLEQAPEVVARWCRHLGFNVKAAFETSGDEALSPTVWCSAVRTPAGCPAIRA